MIQWLEALILREAAQSLRAALCARVELISPQNGGYLSNGDAQGIYQSLQLVIKIGVPWSIFQVGF